jgi:hypothetical protein
VTGLWGVNPSPLTRKELMTKKVVDAFGVRPVTFGVAQDEVRRVVDPLDAAMERLREISGMSFDKPTVEKMKEIRRKALEALSDVRDAKAGRNGR